VTYDDRDPFPQGQFPVRRVNRLHLFGWAVFSVCVIVWVVAMLIRF
jgi:hypothetical protein